MKIISLLFLSAIIFTACSSRELSILDRNSWSADNPKYFKQHIPVRITIHHEGEIFEKGEDAAAHIKKVQVWGMGPDRKWADIPYHFLISPDGTIYEGRNIFTAGETATEYNPDGRLLITCMGNFEVQEVSKELLESLVNLTAYCCRKYQISPETIAAHKDYAETLCPGKNLYPYIRDGYLRDKVTELLKEY